MGKRNPIERKNICKFCGASGPRDVTINHRPNCPDMKRIHRNIQRRLAREQYDRAVKEGKIVPPPVNGKDEDDK